jgi:hypothetical protein
MPENGAWWQVFADPSLDDLIRRADRGNFTIGLAAAQLAEARAIRQATAAAQWPVFALTANATREEGPLTNAASGSGPLYIVGGNLSYEADLFGRFARETKAATTDATEREALLQAAKLLVQADSRVGPGNFTPSRSQVGSRTGAPVRPKYFGCATFPAPSTSNATCGFPALRSPICFMSRLMGPILPGRLSARCVALDSR